MKCLLCKRCGACGALIRFLSLRHFVTPPSSEGGERFRNTKIRLIRDGIVIYTGKLGSLRRFKDDVKEVVAGQDCGLNIENFNDIKVGDIIEGYEEYEEKATL